MDVTYYTRTPNEEAVAIAAQADLDAQNQATQDLETLIQQNIRNLAIQDLQNQGLITSDQATTATASLTALTKSQNTLRASTGLTGTTSAITP